MRYFTSLSRLAVICGLALAGFAPNIWATECSALLNHQLPTLQDKSQKQNLCDYAGKVILVVNTASYCGFTKQYKGLEALYAKYKDKGLVVLGFPSNQFNQETGDEKQIQEFCQRTYKVGFPMFAKSDVAGKNANPFYQGLIKETNGAPKWNFYKYLIHPDGKQVEAYWSLTAPEGGKLEEQIQAWLPK